MNENLDLHWIAKVVKDYKNNPNLIRLNREIEFAKKYPSGEKEYYKKLIFDLYKEIEESSLIGNWWLNAECINPFKKTGIENIPWIKGMVKIWLNSDQPLIHNKLDFIKTDLKKFFEIYFFILIIENKIEEAENKYSVNNNIKNDYVKFWSQFGKINPKTEQPYLSENDIKIFLEQAFGEREIFRTFNPQLTKKELYHAAWLFYSEHKKRFNKIEIAKIMQDNFPNHFEGAIEVEVKKIRDGYLGNKHIFHRI